MLPISYTPVFMSRKAKALSAYIEAQPEKKLSITLEKPNAAVRDYDEGEFDTDLVVIGVVIDGQVYVDGFEMSEETKKAIMEVKDGKAVKVTMFADDLDADTFPSVELDDSEAGQ